jgi:putative DNA primase/helicase
MSITQVVSINQNNKPKVKENQQMWEYKTIDGDVFCATIRTTIGPDKKTFSQWRIENNRWVNKGPEGYKPWYNLPCLKLNPEKPVLIVEGEKTADAAIQYFPEFNVLTWMSGARSVSKTEIEYFAGLDVYLFPDNDTPGYDAMKNLEERLLFIASSVRFIDTKSLGVSDTWDIARLEEGEVDFEDVVKLITETAPTKIPKNLIFNASDYPNLDRTCKKIKPLDTTDNYRFLLDSYNATCRWNMMKRIREIEIPDIGFYVEEQENASLTYVKNLAVVHSLPISRADKHLDLIAWDKCYHPVRDWILSKPQTSPGLLNQFFKTIETTNNEFSYQLIKRWMLSAVSAAFNDSSYCAQGVLVLQGPPGYRKSTFVMSLAPESMNAVKGGLSLDPSKKDDIFTSAAYWIAELGELDATLNKAEIGRLKSHITNDIDDLRRPYAERNSKMIRRTVYAATVNESRFLVDTTGNRRFWTVSITKPIETRHGLDMQQIWREIYDMWKNGEQTYLTDEETAQLNQSNMQFEYLDPLEEKLEEYFDWEDQPAHWMTCTMILDKLGVPNPTRSEATRMANLLKKKGVKKGDETSRMRRSYQMPILFRQYR